MALSREKYLPVILANLLQFLGEDATIPNSDLNITQIGSKVKLMHPETDWFQDSIFNTPDFKKVLSGLKDTYKFIKNLKDVIV